VTTIALAAVTAAAITLAALALHYRAATASARQDADIWQAAYEVECARHDKTRDDLAAVLWTVQIAASEIEPVAANAGERFCCD
jgi:hypothetical protein